MSVVSLKSGRSITMTWDRPPLNVFDLALLREMDQALTAYAQEGEVDVVVFQGAGTRAFSAGVDVRDHTRQKVPEMLETVHGVIRKMLMLPQVTIAAVRGLCLGGGCEIASSCDLIIAAEDGTFATPEILVGCYPPVALARFAQLIGYHRAAEMILTGRRFSAREAQAFGLINRVANIEQFDSGVNDLVHELTSKSGKVLRLTLKELREQSCAGFDQALKRSEAIYRGELLRTEDVEEGVSAFLQKRAPQWRHR